MKIPSFIHLAKQTKGAILIEVLLAFLVFTVGLTGSLALLVHSANINSLNKNRIIAINLAREGVEVVKNIRDTNWLISSANMRACWHFSPDTQEDGDMNNNAVCAPNVAGQNDHPLGVDKNGGRVRSFIADFDPETSRWMLLPAPDYLETDSSSPSYMTMVEYSAGNPNGESENIAKAGDRSIRLYVSSDGRYTHLPTGNAETLFFRTVNIYYIDNPGAGQNELYPAAASFGDPAEGAWRDNRIKVISTVHWKDTPASPVFKTLQLETILTDYLNRENWID